MLRIFWLLILLVAVVFGSVWIADNPGEIRIEWLGYIIEPTIAGAIIALLFTVLVLYLILRSIDEIVSLPKKIKRHNRLRTLEKGLDSANQGFLAIASGNEKQALKKTERAHKLLDQPMTLMLKAQAAQMAGKEAKAEGYYNQLKDQQDTAFVGTKSLLTQARREGDYEKSYALANQAYDLKPQDNNIARTLVYSQMEQEHWQAAHQTLIKDNKQRALEKQERNKLLQLVLIERSRECSNANDHNTALEYAKKAWGIAEGGEQDYIPAISQYAIALHRSKPLKALDLIEKSWSRTHHPALLETHSLIASQSVLKQDLTASQWRKRLSKMSKNNLSKTAEMQMAIANAQASLAADDVEAVQEYLKYQDKQNPAVLRLLAAVSVDDQQNLLTAADAHDSLKLWDCNNCDYLSETWTAVCPSCKTIDCFRYRSV